MLILRLWLNFIHRNLVFLILLFWVWFSTVEGILWVMQQVVSTRGSMLGRCKEAHWQAWLGKWAQSLALSSVHCRKGSKLMRWGEFVPFYALKRILYLWIQMHRAGFLPALTGYGPSTDSQLCPPADCRLGSLLCPWWAAGAAVLRSGDTSWHADKNEDFGCVIVMLRKMTVDILSLSFLSALTSF